MTWYSSARKHNMSRLIAVMRCYLVRIFSIDVIFNRLCARFSKILRRDLDQIRDSRLEMLVS